MANIEGFFTGLAFFYPGDSQAGPQGEVPDAEITIGQMLFGVVGPQGIQLFSAVPPTVIR